MFGILVIVHEHGGGRSFKTNKNRYSLYSVSQLTHDVFKTLLESCAELVLFGTNVSATL